MLTRLIQAAALLGASAMLSPAEAADYTTPFPAFHIAGNLYYVGSKGQAVYLITTPQGNILMNSNYESSVPLIRANVEKLGFKFADTKILIAGHAHPDHVEGDAMLKSLTGAQVVVGYRSEEAEARRVVEAIDGRAVAVKADVATEAELLVERAVRDFGGVSVLVNGAIFTEGTPDEVARDERVKAVYLGESADG